MKHCLKKNAVNAVLAALIAAPLLLASCLAQDRVSGALVRVFASDRMGTGFVIDKSGYIATSYHVVEGSQAISIVLKSGEQYGGKLVCRDRARDLAVVRLDGVGVDLPALTPGDSSMVVEGEQVTVVGYQPGNTTPDKASSFVAGLKKVDGISCLQLNPEITTGRYGAPVINKAGEVIGIVMWDNDDATRAGLAVAINDAKGLLAAALCTDCGDLAISGVVPQSVADTSAIITWQTSKPADGAVEWGPTGSYSNKTTAGEGLSKSHAVVLEGLKPEMTYQYRVISADDCGNEVVAGAPDFTTVAAGLQSGALSIINVNVTEISSSGASVTWVTNKPADSVLFYGTDEASMTATRRDSNYVYDHKISFEGLSPEVRYYVRVESVTEKGETAQAAALPFKTRSTSPLCCKLSCKLPEFVFKDMEGNDFTQDDLAGRKVCMTFTKTTCSICMGQAVYLNDIYQSWPKGDILFMCIANREKPADINEWMKRYGLTVPVYNDVEGELVNFCHMRTIPSTLCVNEKGIICYSREGPFGSKKEFEEALKAVKW